MLTLAASVFPKGFQNIHMARESIVSLILGKPPGKVYNNLRTVSARMKERF